jgi:two-component system OmpR family sensor kinase
MISSVRARLTLWYVGMLAAVLVLFSVGVYGLLARLLYERLDTDLRSIQHVAVTSLTHDSLEGQSLEDAAESTARELTNPPQAVTIYDVNGRLLAENSFDDDPPPRPPLDRLTTVGFVDVYTEPEEPGDDDMRRVVAQRVRVTPGDRDYIILVNEPLEAIDEELGALREAFAYAIPAALVLAGIGGWFLAQRSLRPAVEMSREARRIGAEDPDRRLPVANPDDELGQLATSFNELLGRLNEAIALQRQFMADASHELRTPLSVVGTAVDVTLEREHRDEEEYREALSVIGEQNDRLSRAVEDMFTLARADSGRYPLRREAFYLDELVAGTARAARVLGERRGVEVVDETDGEAPFAGDEHLVRQLVMNLVENAIKHTSEGGTVRVALERAPSSYTITVADTGSGIPAEAQAHVFERFYRADRARSRAESSPGSGAGLGLPISRWIAEVHDGRLELVRSDASGTTFRAVLPRAR